jgi:hypothetical protein
MLSEHVHIVQYTHVQFNLRQNFKELFGEPTSFWNSCNIDISVAPSLYLVYVFYEEGNRAVPLIYA